MSDAPLLDVRDLRVVFQQDGRRFDAVKGISFSVARGRTLAIVGESGSGKSVTAMSILRLLPPAAMVSGTALLKGEDILKLSERRLRGIRGAAITMVFQEPMTSLNPLHTIERQVGEILELHGGLKGAALRRRIIELLTEVGIPDPAQRLSAYPHQLSGGQRQRVMIAMALANRPDLFIADEPTTALDVTVQAQILTLLKDLQQRYGMAMLFITHDLNIVRKLADDVAVMQKGEIVEAGSVAEIFKSPQHPYTKALLAAEPKGTPPQSDPSAPVVLEAQDIRVHFPIRRGLLRRTVGAVKAVDGISLALRQGETLGIVGEFGSGKTTLGLAVLRLIRSQGPIVYLGRRIDGLSFRAMRPLRRDMQIVFQDPYGSLSPRLSIADIVAEGLIAQGTHLSLDERREIVAKALADTGLDPAAMDRYPHEFSAASGSASRLHGRWCWSRNSSCSTSRHRRWTCRCRRKSSICCGNCSRSGISPICLSATICVSCARSLMRSSSCVTARSWSKVPQREIFANPQSDYTRALFAAAFAIEADRSGVVAQ